MTTDVGPASQTDAGFRVLGTRPIRHDGVEKVTGRARYGADVHMPGLLHGKILRSPHPHARIRRIDTSRAEALPDVKAVTTAADLPILADRTIDFAEIRGNARMLAENVLARSKVLYKGHAVAAVAATSPHVAEEALGLIDVEYEVLPTVLTLRDAMRPDAPLLHEDMTTRSTFAFLERGNDTEVKSNVSFRIQFKNGDVEEGFREADVIVEREFTTQTVHQGYIEPQTSTAWWAPDGQVTVWTSTQGPFAIRAETAMILGIPESLVRVIPMEIGGGFGGKLDTYLDPVAAILSRKSGQPVKLVMTRAEVLEASGPTSATNLRAKIGATDTGRITSAEISMIYEAGAFPGSPVGEGAMSGSAAYKIDNILIDGCDVVCNKPKVAAYRAPGTPAAAFAVESVLDELARRLDMDPLDLRKENLAHKGDRMPNGLPQPQHGGEQLVDAMKRHPHYQSDLGGPNRGRGIALGYWKNASMQSCAAINVNSDGTISLVTGSVDIGGTRAAVAMQAAEALGLAAADVHPIVVDTDSVGWTGLTGGSRVAVDTGRAALQAAEEAKREMAARAALLWEVEAKDVAFDNGEFVCTKGEGRRITWKELAEQLPRLGGLISVSSVAHPAKAAPAVAGNIVDVEVEPETGKVNVLRVTVFQDVGQAAHPSYVEGQMQGGTVQGIGWALTETYSFTSDGIMANSSFLDYRMPTSLDVPNIDPVVIEIPSQEHPFGMRGVGEVSIVPPLAAVANAVSDAIGVRMTRLPITPAEVLTALSDK